MNGPLYDKNLPFLWRTAVGRLHIQVVSPGLHRCHPLGAGKYGTSNSFSLPVLVRNLLKIIVPAQPSSLGFFSHCPYIRYLKKITGEAEACQALSRGYSNEPSFRAD